MSSPPVTTLAELLTVLMRRDRMSFEFLANELGMKKSSVHDLLAGRNKGTHPTTIAKIAALFNVDVNYLYGLTNQIPPNLREYLRDRPEIWEGIRKMMERDAKTLADEEAASAAHRQHIAATYENRVRR